MKLKDLKLPHFADFNKFEDDEEEHGELSMENPVCFFKDNQWHQGYFALYGITEYEAYIYGEMTLEDAYKAFFSGRQGSISFNGSAWDEESEFDYEELNPEMEVYPIEALGSLAHEIKQDEGQPQRAVMNYLLDQSKLLDMPFAEFLELVKDSAHQLLEDHKEEIVLE